MSTSKTGKHGHAKVHLVAIDVGRPSQSALKLLTILFSDLHWQEIGKFVHIPYINF